MKRRRKARPVNPTDFDRDSLISRAEAVRVIAQEIEQTNEPSREVRNRVSKRVRDAFDKGKLHYRGPDRICFGDLARWAQDAWPGDFREWPAIRPHVANPLPGTARLPPIRATGTGRVLEADTVNAWRNYATGLESKYEELHDAYLKLFFECDGLRQETERLRAYEKKAEQTREKKRQAGMKGGRGRSWEKSK